MMKTQDPPEVINDLMMSTDALYVKQHRNEQQQTYQKPKEAWEELIDDDDEHPVTEIVPESKRPSLKIFDAAGKVERTTSDAAMLHLLEKNYQDAGAPASSLAGTIVSSAEMRTEEGQERASVPDDGFD